MPISSLCCWTMHSDTHTKLRISYIGEGKRERESRWEGKHNVSWGRQCNHLICSFTAEDKYL